MDNTLTENKRETTGREGLAPPAKSKTKAFLIGKKLKTNTLHHTAAERGKRDGNKTQPKTPDSLRQGGKSSRWRGSYAALRPCG